MFDLDGAREGFNTKTEENVKGYKKMGFDIKDTRTREEKKQDRMKAEETAEKVGSKFYDVLKKKDIIDALDYGYMLDRIYLPIDITNYDEYICRRFIDAYYFYKTKTYSISLELDVSDKFYYDESWLLYTSEDRGDVDTRNCFLYGWENLKDVYLSYYKDAPACFDSLAERYHATTPLKYCFDHHYKEPRNYLNQSKKENKIQFEQQDAKAKEYAKLWLSRQEIFRYRDFMQLLDASDSELWQKKLTPDYMMSMAIIYQVMKVRGITPSPEAEEQIKYEILEHAVHNLLLVSSVNIKNERNGAIEKRIVNKGFVNGEKSIQNDISRATIFKNIAMIYAGMKNLINASYNKKYNYYSRSEFFTIIPDSNNISRIYMHDYAGRAWKAFKEENLREILFMLNNPRGLYDFFKDELENIDLSYDAVCSDPEWKDYVFTPHRSAFAGGERSPMKINPPMLFEALIDRSERLRIECEKYESKFSQEELDINEQYLQLKGEYYFTYLQVHHMNEIYEKDMKEYDSFSEEDKSSLFAPKAIKSLWTAQLGKYANLWKRNPQIALIDEQTSEESFHIKQQVARAIEDINKKLAKLNSYLPHYDYFLPFEDKDAHLFENFRKGIPEDMVEFESKIGLHNPGLRDGIYRQHQYNVALHKKGTELWKNREKNKEEAAQKAFKASNFGDELYEKFAEYISYGIKWDTIKDIYDEAKENKRPVKEKKEEKREPTVKELEEQAKQELLSHFPGYTFEEVYQKVMYPNGAPFSKKQLELLLDYGYPFVGLIDKNIDDYLERHKNEKLYDISR